MSAIGIEIKHIHEANAYFGQCLSAALELGSPTYLEQDLGWVSTLLVGRQITNDLLGRYLRMYHQAARAVMGSAGSIVTDWLQSISTKY